jgi:hypothetical protein
LGFPRAIAESGCSKNRKAAYRGVLSPAAIYDPVKLHGGRADGRRGGALTRSPPCARPNQQREESFKIIHIERLLRKYLFSSLYPVIDGEFENKFT